MSDFEELIKVKNYLSQEFLKKGKNYSNWTASIINDTFEDTFLNAQDNVHAIGIGKKIIAGKKTNINCVSFFVINKIPFSKLPWEAVLPARVGNIPTDVIQTPPAFFIDESFPSINTSAKQIPIIGGISIGSVEVDAGTLGCFCKSNAEGDDPNKIYILSNNHVLANIDRVEIGYDIYQPAKVDDCNLVAKLHRKVGLKAGEENYNNVDAAIAEVILKNYQVDTNIWGIGSIQGTENVSESMEVCKQGVNGYSEGMVTHIYTDSFIPRKLDGINVYKFENQFRIEKKEGGFATKGDSGSLIINKANRKAVGLLFASSSNGTYGYANQIQYVLDELQISLL